MLVKDLSCQDRFLMKEKQLQLTYQSQTKINIFQKSFTNGETKFNVI